MTSLSALHNPMITIEAFVRAIVGADVIQRRFWRNVVSVPFVALALPGEGPADYMPLASVSM